MPPSNSIAAFAALSFALIVVPGPSVMFVIARAVSLGRRAALLTVPGNATGIFLQVVSVAVGLGALVERSVVVFTAIKLAGAAYLMWLGLQAIRHRSELAKALDVTESIEPKRSVLLDGLVVGVANPKSIVFFSAILRQFVEPAGAPAGVQMVVLGLVFVVVALASDAVWGISAGTAGQWFASSPRRLGRLGAAGGVAMIGLGAQLAITGRKD